MKLEEATPAQLERLVGDLSDWYHIDFDVQEFDKAKEFMPKSLLGKLIDVDAELDKFIQEVARVYKEKTGKSIWDVLP